MRKTNRVKAIIAIAVVMSFGAIFSVNAKQKKLRESPEAKKIKAVLDRQVEAWNRQRPRRIHERLLAIGQSDFLFRRHKCVGLEDYA